MKSVGILCSFCLGAMMVACVSGETYEGETRIGWDDFEKVELTGRELFFDEEIMNPYHLAVRDSFLLTLNQNTEKICHIFNLNTKKKVGERIMMGQGPNDMIHPFFIETKEALMFYAPMTSSIFRFSLDEFVKEIPLRPLSKKKLAESYFFGELSLLGDNWIGVSGRPDAPCNVFDSEGNKVQALGKYPVGPENYSELEKVDAYNGILATDGKSRVAVCCMFTDLIDFYDESGHLLKRLHGPERFYTRFVEFNDGRIMGSRPDGKYYRDAFYSPYGTDTHLFVLFNGKFVNKPGYNLLAKDILVFDWEGNPVRRYSLDKGIMRITVDSHNRKIYGISDSPEYHIVEFDY